MRACDQTPGLTIWRHGEMVAERYAELLAFLRAGGGGELPGWRLPSWVVESAELLLSRQVDFDSAQRYQLFHDCGKPYVIEFDESGRRHFPEHAAASGRLWRGLGGSELESELMTQDMDAHKLSAADLPEFAARPTAATLLLTALCEVHANAEMFGGLESVGFKAKWKHLDRRGKALCQMWHQGAQ
jgi:hypothetical protein